MRANKGDNWKNWEKKGGKGKTKSESEKGRRTIRGEGGVVPKIHRDNRNWIV